MEFKELRQTQLDFDENRPHRKGRVSDTAFTLDSSWRQEREGARSGEGVCSLFSTLK